MNHQSNSQNTVIYVSVSNFTPTKKIILEGLVKSNKYQIILGVDVSSNGVLDFFKHFNGRVDFIKVEKNFYFDKYGDKIKNFNGRWPDNCAKLAAYDWFHESSFEYMWYMEDDVYAKDWGSFFQQYGNFTEDYLGGINDSEEKNLPHPGISELPFWAFDKDPTGGNIGWRIGKLIHVLHNSICHLYLHRASKRLASRIIESIQEDSETSHHELWLPYVLNLFKYSYSELNSADHEFSRFNGLGEEDSGIDSDLINTQQCNIFHPVKKLT